MKHLTWNVITKKERKLLTCEHHFLLSVKSLNRP